MKEEQFVGEVKKIVENFLDGGKYEVKDGYNLYYRLYLDNENKLNVDLNKKVSRGQSAFQTDLCIYEKIKVKECEIPKIVIEFKNKITTHDIITYSNKARKHKQIYPYLRYGLISYNLSKIPKRFFIHNEDIDFYLIFEDPTSDKHETLKKLIEQELEYLQNLEEMLEKEIKIFRTEMFLEEWWQ